MNRSPRRWPQGLLLAALLVAAACSDEAAPGGAAPTLDAGVEDRDASGGSDASPGDASNNAPDDAGGGSDTGSGLLPVGEICTDSAECDSRFCFFLPETEQGFCTIYCIEDANCPEGAAACAFLQNNEDEIAKVCVSRELCIDEDDDGFGAGPGCTGRDCDDGDGSRNPGASEVCDGVDNDCDGAVDDNPIDANVACATGSEGICAEGQQRCILGRLECETLRFAQPEACDGLDNDCDGSTDEDDAGAPLGQACYSGPEGTAGVGACAAGVRTCAEGQIGECVGQVLPFLEACDGVDNDCDGQTDEGMPNTGLACDSGLEGSCRAGQTQCDASGAVVCAALESPGEEVCDGVDNDCDGLVDEDAQGDPLSRPCYDGAEGTEDVGVCVGGTQTCQDSAFGACVGQQLPGAEICDTVDNDCDGVADEGNPAGGQLCSTGLLGVCARGETACGDAGVICLPILEPLEELCDNQDNDCDGEVDEGPGGGPLVRSCYNGPAGTEGQGICAAGSQTCQGGGFGGCLGEVRPQVETCDGVDNDCDGAADDGNPGGGAVCSTGEQGACASGLTVCDSGALQCASNVEASAEVCDGLDNDCDGMTDEGDGGGALTRGCYNGPAGTEGVGICAPGAQTCQGGTFAACVDATRPGVEVCDGLDNDCDGQLDEGSPGAGIPCSTGEAGVCADGVTACNASGAIVCVRRTAPGAEVCDGLDNDCDGMTDEADGGGALTRSCYSGPAGTAGVGSCAAGTQTCQGGAFAACGGQMLPQTEQCDGLDNDCDGFEDDGNPGGELACSTGLPGVCAAGATLCRDGAVECIPSELPSLEVCDGEDNNCNGAVDEDAMGAPLSRSCYSGPNGTAGVGICRTGTQTCQGGGFSACGGQTLPQGEVCDGVDNDCDGAADDGNPGGGVACTTGQPGICAPGHTTCQGGGVICLRDSAPEPERCDAIDNDCDGQVDDGFAGLGDTCFAGLGVCERAGVRICDPGDPQQQQTLCTAQPAASGAADTCDYLDDDCDGDVDEDFRSAGGVYNTLTSCGGCGVSCNNSWPGGPALYHVTPTCQVGGGAATCGFTCEDNYFNLDQNPDNGCEFTPDPAAIYVATPANGGVSAGTCGAWNAPCSTLGQGLARASALTRTRLRVSSGQFRENVTLVNGISVLGGHNPSNWNRNPDIFSSAILGSTPNPTGADRIAVTASGLTASTELSGFTVNAESAGPGGNSIAVYILNSDDSFVLRDNVIFGGSGGNGLSGGSGGSGANGTHASAGLASVFCAPNGSCSARSGGAGGARTCGGVSVSGGSGGSSNNPRTNARGGVGANGGTALGGPGGREGGNGVGTVSGGVRSCGYNNPTDPLPGTPGTPGSDGAGASANADIDGFFDAMNQWRGRSGNSGVVGQNGGGGGGGGSAGGIDATDTNQNGVQDSNATVYYGASGGGGGSGGCGGASGQGGQPGGGSFAVLVAFTGAGPSNASQMPTLLDNHLVRGQGGQGGRGGDGGSGGDPGLGAGGGDGVITGGDFSFCMVDGGVGAQGGRGGHAGGGAGGNGGVSVDIFVQNDNSVNAGYDATNTFELANNVQTSGTGGLGGSSSNRTNGLGSSGNQGAAANVYRVP